MVSLPTAPAHKFARQVAMYSALYLTLDESCGNFCNPNSEKLYVQIFANYLHELPPLKRKGDFIFLYNVEITDWQGQ